MKQIINYLDELHSTSFTSINKSESLGLKFYHFSICGNHTYVVIKPKHINNQLISYVVSFGKLYLGQDYIFEDVLQELGDINEKVYNILLKRSKSYEVYNTFIKNDILDVFKNLYKNDLKC